MQPQTRVEIVKQTIDDYKADQWLWHRWGIVTEGADPDSRIFKVHAAQLGKYEPLVDVEVVDLGAGVGRIVRVTALEDTGVEAGELDPVATFPDNPLPDDAGDPVDRGGHCAL